MKSNGLELNKTLLLIYGADYPESHFEYNLDFAWRLETALKDSAE